MAITGYDSRTPGRDTFAAQGPAPVQIGGRVALDGGSQAAQIVGGGAVQGQSNAGNITVPTENMATDLGEFFTELTRPYVERVKQQKFFEGFTRAQSGEAIDELSRSHKSVVGKLFGPTPLEQGAQFYTAMKKVDDWHVAMTEDMDRLKTLTPTELSQELAKTSMGMMGDDPFVNQLVQKQLIEKSGPLVDQISKERYIWQQDTARQTMFDALSSSGRSLQVAAAAQAQVADPSDESQRSMDAMVDNFRGMMQKPVGMSDDTYQKTLAASLVSFAQHGDYYAYNSLIGSGVMDVLTDEQQKKVEDAYDRYKGKTFEAAKGRHVEELLQVKLDMSKRQLSPLEAVARVDAINAAITAETGIDERAYDTGYLMSTGGDIIAMLASDNARDEERAYQEKREIAREERDEARRIREEQENFGAASAALQMGHPRDYLMKGGKADAMEKAWISAYQSGNLTAIARSFANEGETQPALSRMMQSDVTAGGGVTFTEQVKKGFGTWQAMMKENPSAAAAYFGGQHSRLLFMQQMIDDRVSPEIAYQRAFADTDKARHTGATLRPEDRQETRKALEAAVNGTDSWRILAWTGYQPRRMGDSAKKLLLDTATEFAGTYQRNSKSDPTTIAQMAVGKVRGSNMYEWYGGNMAWSNKSGTKKAHQVIGVPELKFGDILNAVVDERLKGIGISSGADSEYEVDRVPVDGGFVLLVKPSDPDHAGTPVLISSNELKERAAKDARSEVQGNQSSNKVKYNGVNAFRYVRGESTWQRQKRITREVSAGADPVNHSPLNIVYTDK